MPFSRGGMTQAKFLARAPYLRALRVDLSFPSGVTDTLDLAYSFRAVVALFPCGRAFLGRSWSFFGRRSGKGPPWREGAYSARCRRPGDRAVRITAGNDFRVATFTHYSITTPVWTSACGKTCPPRPHCRSRQDAAVQGVIIPAGGGRLGHS